MTRYSPAVAAAQWNGQNAAFHLLAGGCPVMRLRYEDVVAAPEAAVRRIADFAGLAAPGSSRVPRRDGCALGRLEPGTQRLGQPDAIRHREDRRSGGTSGGGRACRPGSGTRSPR